VVRLPVQSFVAEATRRPPEIPDLACVSVIETAAEKLVSLTRRTAMEMAGVSRDPDPTFVRISTICTWCHPLIEEGRSVVMVRNRGYPRQSGYARIDQDFYVEPRWVVHLLLDVEPLQGSVLDPCCGSGTIPSVCLERGVPARGSDLVYRGFREVRDLFSIIEPVDNIISNVPYKIAERCACLTCAASLHGSARRPRDLRDIVPDAVRILPADVYGWFARTERGIYRLTALGDAALLRWPCVAQTLEGELSDRSKTVAHHPGPISRRTECPAKNGSISAGRQALMTARRRMTSPLWHSTCTVPSIRLATDN
jgi:Putative PD-(D/E)XK phosphodiesterase (DUF2161)